MSALDTRTHILLVDPSDTIGSLLTARLRDQHGFVVETVATNDAAIKHVDAVAVGKARIDVICGSIGPLGNTVFDLIGFIRGMSARACGPHGLSIRGLPVVIVDDRLPDFEEEIRAVDGIVELRRLTDGLKGLLSALSTTVRRYRHGVLADMERLGIAVAWHEGRFRLHTGHASLGGRPSRYFNDVRGLDLGYSRIYLLTQRFYGAQYALDEFEELINRDQVLERDLQEFFQRQPEFLLGGEFDSYYSEPNLRRPSSGRSFRPDFVLQPSGQRSNPRRWGITELKLPTDEVLVSTFHQRLSAAVNKGLTQLQDYRRYFADPSNAAELRARFGGVVPTAPALTLLIGRGPVDHARVGELMDNSVRLDLRTYDEVLAWRRAQVSRLVTVGKLGRP